MRKTIAIFLSLLLLFNFIGYRVLIGFLQEQAEMLTEKRISETKYDEAALKTVTVPLNMPYQQESTQFEMTEGKVNISGISYHYVKRKIYHGQLILKCLPDIEKARLDEAGNSYYSLVNDMGKHPVKGSPLTSVVKKAFTPFAFNEAILSAVLNTGEGTIFPEKKKLLLSFRSLNVPGKPPDKA